MRIGLLESISGVYGSFAAGEEAGWPEAKLEDIAETVHEIDDQLDDMAEWQEKHQEFHDQAARTPR